MTLDERMAKIEKAVEEHGKRIVKLESLVRARPETATKKMSIKVFLLSKKPRNGVEKILAVGYYLEKHEDIVSFNVKDLEKALRDAKEQVPKNINHKVYLNIKKGHMMGTSDKKDKLKAWVLTNSGDQHVEDGFGKR